MIIRMHSYGLVIILLNGCEESLPFVFYYLFLVIFYYKSSDWSEWTQKKRPL